MERRSFLKMLGIVGAGLIQPSLVIGGSGGSAAASSLIAPPPSHVDPRLVRNWVVYPSRKLGANFGRIAALAREFSISPSFPPGCNPHEVFFKGALELQRQIGEATLEVLGEIPTYMTEHVELVTSILMPIHTRARHCWATNEEAAKLKDEDLAGFDIVADLAIEARGWGMRDRLDLGRRGGTYDVGGKWRPNPSDKVYSEVGEYPIELPTTLDLGHLMRVSTMFDQKDEGLRRRLGSILLQGK